jgi:HEAT repeats
MTLEKGLAAFLNRACAREGHVDRHSSKGFEDRKQKDHGMIDAALIEQLSIPHRAPAAYRALLAMGFLAVLLARQGLRHANAAVRYRCCTLLDHYLVPDVLADLVRALDDPHPRVRVAALHALTCGSMEGERVPTRGEQGRVVCAKRHNLCVYISATLPSQAVVSRLPRRSGACAIAYLRAGTDCSLRSRAAQLGFFSGLKGQ